MSFFLLLVVWGIWSGAKANNEHYHRHVIDECGATTCTETEPDCVKRFSDSYSPLRCMNGKTLCHTTIKHFLDLNNIDFDEYVVFDEAFIEALFALPPPDHAGNTSWVYLRDRQFEYTEMTFKPHTYPDYVFLMTDSDYYRCIFF